MTVTFSGRVTLPLGGRRFKTRVVPRQTFRVTLLIKRLPLPVSGRETRVKVLTGRLMRQWMSLMDARRGRTW